MTSLLLRRARRFEIGTVKRICLHLALVDNAVDRYLLPIDIARRFCPIDISAGVRKWRRASNTALGMGGHILNSK